MKVSRVFILLGLAIATRGAVAMSSDERVDSATVSTSRLSLAAGFNQGVQARQEQNLLLSIGPKFRLSERWSLPIEIELWRLRAFERIGTYPRFVVSGEYRILEYAGWTAYPKVGLGILFMLPVFTADFGFVAQYAVSPKVAFYVEVAGLSSFEDGSVIVTSPLYVKVGVIL